MRLLERVEIETPEELKKDNLESYENWHQLEVTDSLSARSGLEKKWRHLLDLYAGKPENEWSMDSVPVQQVEVTLGAIASDALAAQAHATIFQANPPVTCRGNDGAENAAKHIQTLLNHLAVEPFMNFVTGSDEMILDTVQLGTGALFTIWQDDIKKTGLTRMVARGPRMFSLSPDDLLVPGGTRVQDPDLLKLIGYRTTYTKYELEMRGKALGWDIDKAVETNAEGAVQRERDRIQDDRNTDKYRQPTYSIMHGFSYFDIDGDGLEEDLYSVYDLVSKKILFVAYNGFDSRPFSLARYQLVPHKFYGLGVLEMCMPFQKAATDWYNFNTANAKLANSRYVTVKWGSPLAGSKIRLMPNKPLFVNDPSDIQFNQCGDIYPSSAQREMLNWHLADRRTGQNQGLSGQGQGQSSPGKRTPAATAMTIVQQINQRFMPAFDSMRGCQADALGEAILRFQEKWQGGDEGTKQYIHEYITKIVGTRGAAIIEKAFGSPTADIREAVTIEMTAATQSINREADRQSGVVVLQLLNTYYQQMFQAAVAAVNPQLPPQLKQLAVKLAGAATESMDRILRSFDQIRDPSLFLIEAEELQILLGGQPQLGNVQSGSMAGGDQGGQGNAGELSPSPEGAASLSLGEIGPGPELGGDLEATGVPLAVKRPRR